MIRAPGKEITAPTAVSALVLRPRRLVSAPAITGARRQATRTWRNTDGPVRGGDGEVHEHHADETHAEGRERRKRYGGPSVGENAPARGATLGRLRG
jgi:hypothetical protein